MSDQVIDVGKAFLGFVRDNPPPCTAKGVDPEIFFQGASSEITEDNFRRAKEICHTCPIIWECLRFAYDSDDRHAVLGGRTPAERGMEATWSRSKAKKPKKEAA